MLLGHIPKPFEVNSPIHWLLAETDIALWQRGEVQPLLRAHHVSPQRAGVKTHRTPGGQTLDHMQAHFTTTQWRAPPPCSILPHPASTWGPSQGLAQRHPKSNHIKTQKLLLHWGKVLLLICLWHKTFPRSSPTWNDIRKAFNCSPAASCSLTHQELSHMFSYISKAVILEPFPYFPPMSHHSKIFNWYFVKDLNYHVRDLPPAMNNRKGTF